MVNSKAQYALVLTIFVWAFIALFLINFEPAECSPESPPRFMLWAWERPEHLAFINPANTGVAFLSRTITIKNGNFSVKHRAQPLIVKPNIYLIAVIRIETDGKLNEVDQLLLQQCSNTICSALQPHIKGIQIDFDARQSERGWYRLLIEKVRQTLPRDIFFSMTALVSWCLGDDWLQGLPVDEVVPMFFQMGADSEHIKMFLRSGRLFNHHYRALGINAETNIGSHISTHTGTYSGVNTIANDAEINQLLGKYFSRTAWDILNSNFGGFNFRGSKFGGSDFGSNFSHYPRIYMFSSIPWSKASVCKSISEVAGWQ